MGHPKEPYSLWMFEHESPTETFHETTLKDKGAQRRFGLERAEFRGPIHEDLFRYYDDDVPTLTQYRYRPNQHVSLDFSDTGRLVRAESDNPAAWNHFVRVEGLDDYFFDATANRRTDNVWLAHLDYKNKHGGREALAPIPKPEVEEIFSDIESMREDGKKVIVQLGGRSGAGKSYTVRELRKKLSSHQIKSIVISTDDYNQGKKYLYALANKRGQERWVNYDKDEVWDLPLVKAHLLQLLDGKSIPQFEFDFNTEERQEVGTINPQDYDVYIVEGIKANHPIFHGIAHLSYEIPTPFATSLGQRDMRDWDQRQQFGHPRKNTLYYVNLVEPEYRAATGLREPYDATDLYLEHLPPELR